MANTQYLCFTAEEPNSTVSLMAKDSAPVVDLMTSRDGDTWSPYTVGNTITLSNVGDFVQFKAGPGGNQAMGTSSDGYNYFSMTGKVAASGNLVSLLDETCTMNEIVAPGAFRRIFFECMSLVKAPEIPFTKLSDYCFKEAFQKVSITETPMVQATVYGVRACDNMFSWNTKLTKLNFTDKPISISDNSFKGFFYNVASLVDVPEAIRVSTPSTSSFDALYQFCSSIKIPTSFYVNELPSSLFYNTYTGCSSLSQPIKIYMIDNTSVPTLSSRYYFEYIGYDYVIYVPKNLYNSWIKATNWSSIASHIYPYEEPSLRISNMTIDGRKVKELYINGRKVAIKL